MATKKNDFGFVKQQFGFKANQENLETLPGFCTLYEKTLLSLPETTYVFNIKSYWIFATSLYRYVLSQFLQDTLS